VCLGIQKERIFLKIMYTHLEEIWLGSPHLSLFPSTSTKINQKKKEEEYPHCGVAFELSETMHFKIPSSWTPVAHACKPGYLGG
jgi:hypothetical protein